MRMRKRKTTAPPTLRQEVRVMTSTLSFLLLCVVAAAFPHKSGSLVEQPLTPKEYFVDGKVARELTRSSRLALTCVASSMWNYHLSHKSARYSIYAR